MASYFPSGSGDDDGLRHHHRQPHPVPCPSADAGTLIEVGWFYCQGRPVFGYSNSAVPFAACSAADAATCPNPIENLPLEGFGLAGNLMPPGAVLYGGGLPIALPADGVSRAFDTLDVFASCVATAAGGLAWPGKASLPACHLAAAKALHKCST